MGRSPAGWGFYFAIVPSGYILGNFITGRFAGRVGTNRMILAGTFMVMASVAAMAAVFATGVMHPTALFGPMFFIGAGNGLVLPSGIAGAVSVRPDLAGAAAGLAGSLQIGFGALVAPFVGATLDTTVGPSMTIDDCRFAYSGCVVRACRRSAQVNSEPLSCPTPQRSSHIERPMRSIRTQQTSRPEGSRFHKKAFADSDVSLVRRAGRGGVSKVLLTSRPGRNDPSEPSIVERACTR